MRVLGYAANGSGDELALRMLAQFIADLPVALEVATTRVLVSELTEYVRANEYSIVCIADFPRVGDEDPLPGESVIAVDIRRFVTVPERTRGDRWGAPLGGPAFHATTLAIAQVPRGTPRRP